MSLLAFFVRTKFNLTSRAAATGQIERETELTLAVAERLGPASSSIECTVPAMLGVDPEMRGWSVFQIIDHNNIVHRHLTQAIESICRGQTYESDFDPKHDPMPRADCGPEVLTECRNVIGDYLAMIEQYPKLRRTVKMRHPVFIELDAHQYHCMVGFHSMMHRKQAEKVEQLLDRGPSSPNE